ncbi:MAG: uracil-DNA glycosylase [Spartobacteria bacterium]|nr:uracil-DNA glycosylase [Spartobacteria bacterium]
MASTLAEIAAAINQCTKCPLHKTRTNTVVGQGSSSPDIAFIGEGPGAQEDLKGQAFIGPAGEILTRLLTRMGYTRDDIWIGNIVKCRPSVDLEMKKDRPPTSQEMSTCLPYLQAQLAILKPRVIVTLGNVALEGLFGFKGITRHHGKWLRYEGIDTMPTYHPSYLLRKNDKKLFWDVWHDMEQVLKRLGKTPLPPPPSKKH